MRHKTMFITAFAVALATSAAAQTPCFGPAVGPGPCEDAGPPGDPIGPTEWCLQGQCQPIVYSWSGDMAIAASTLPNGYAVLGWSGPCRHSDRALCPDIFNQAAADLRMNALRANRAQAAAP